MTPLCHLQRHSMRSNCDLLLLLEDAIFITTINPWVWDSTAFGRIDCLSWMISSTRSRSVPLSNSRSGSFHYSLLKLRSVNWRYQFHMTVFYSISIQSECNKGILIRLIWRCSFWSVNMVLYGACLTCHRAPVFIPFGHDVKAEVISVPRRILVIFVPICGQKAIAV